LLAGNLFNFAPERKIMAINSKTDDSSVEKPAKALTTVLRKSERVKDLVEEAAVELSSANDVLKEGLSTPDVPTSVETALAKSEVAEEKVQEASEELAVVNSALQREIHERQVLEFHYAAATEQKDAAHIAALHDPMTGLPNRALFNDRIEHGLAQAVRHNWSLAVMFLDLNNFKEINDTHGHNVGDIVLLEISARLKEITRADDTISRHGGDEFLYLMLESGDKQDVTAVAEKLIAAIEVPCVVSTTAESKITSIIRASIGVAMFPKDGNTAEVLITAADKAMYRAKKDKSGYAFVE
jgi:diguanylate cyclase